MSEIGYEEFEEFVDHLKDASNSLEKALDCLYKRGGIKRGIGYRMRLGNSQSDVMTLLVRELNRKEGKNTDGSHEWELVDTSWECIYCERRTSAKRVGNKLVLWPDTLRRIPLYGRKWRCTG